VRILAAFMAWTLRTAELEDAERLARCVADGFAAYREFAPTDWDPPAFEGQLTLFRQALPDPDVYCLLAEAEDGELAGLVTVRPGTFAPMNLPEDAAFLWRLFVEPPFYGTGVAKVLHDEGLREAGERGYSVIHLLAAAGQERARRFYEREGWVLVGDPFVQEGFGMDVVEYRRPISSSV
jgi:GNAT superfamily N-acetyltransferase